MPSRGMTPLKSYAFFNPALPVSPFPAVKNRPLESMANETQAAANPKARAAIIPVTAFEQNCTLIWCEATKRAVVIDPGGDVPNIEEAIAQSGVTVEKIWLTHGHLDHARRCG